MARVLVVDHSQDLQEAQRMLLCDAGFDVIGAIDGARGTLCLINTSAHEFRREDLRVLEALGLATARAFETRKWPLDEDGVFGHEFLDLFVDTLLVRAGRPSGGGIAAAIEAHTPTPTAKGVAVVRLDAQRRVLLWGGEAGTWALSDAARLVGRVEISEEENRARVRALCL